MTFNIKLTYVFAAILTSVLNVQHIVECVLTLFLTGCITVVNSLTDNSSIFIYYMWSYAACTIKQSLVLWIIA